MSQSGIGVSVIRALTRLVPFAVVGTRVGIDQSEAAFSLFFLIIQPFAIDLSKVGLRVEIDVGARNGLIHPMAVDLDREAVQQDSVVSIGRLLPILGFDFLAGRR